jgi:hypothetical protein
MKRASRLSCHGRDHFRVAVPEQQCPVSHHVTDELVPVEVPLVRAAGSFDSEGKRLCSPHLVRHAAREHAARPGEVRTGARVLGCPPPDQSASLGGSPRPGRDRCRTKRRLNSADWGSSLGVHAGEDIASPVALFVRSWTKGLSCRGHPAVRRPRYPEAPVVLPDGRIVFCGGNIGDLPGFDVEAVATYVKTSGSPWGTVLGSDGAVYVTEGGDVAGSGDTSATCEGGTGTPSRHGVLPPGGRHRQPIARRSPPGRAHGVERSTAPSTSDMAMRGQAIKRQFDAPGAAWTSSSES